MASIIEQTEISGIILKITPQKERDGLLQVLSESGKTYSLLCYGAQAGGKSNKAAVVQVGNLVDFNLQKKAYGEVGNIKELKLKWGPDRIRTNYQAFQLQSFFFELALALAIKGDIRESETDLTEHKGLFRVVSNALFYTNQSSAEASFCWESLLATFLAKIVFEEGICPELSSCSHCQEALGRVREAFRLDLIEGQFICSDCGGGDSEMFDSRVSRDYRFHIQLWGLLTQVWKLKFSEFSQVGKVDREVLNILYFYVAKQYNFDPRRIQSSQYLFA